MPDIRLVLTDMDGTLVEPEAYDISLRVREAIKTAEAQGVKICAVTGRPFEMAEPVFRILGLQDPCVTDGGATIVNPVTGHVLWSRWLEAEQARAVIAVLVPHASALAVGSSMTALKPADINPETYTESLSQVWANVPAEVADELVAQINQVPGVIAHSNPEPGGAVGRMGVQATHEHADKAYGVEQLLTMMEADKETVLAIGDGNNDLPLFTHAAVKVAVANATEKLKTAADVTVASVYDDGFVEMLKRFVLQ